jgi:hypothetical protein
MAARAGISSGVPYSAGVAQSVPVLGHVAAKMPTQSGFGRKLDIVLAANIAMAAAKTTSTIPAVCKKSQDGSHRHYLKS